MKQHVRIAIVFGPLAAAFAQFSQPAVTDDGRQVYFISPLILSGAPPDTSPASHLYRFGPDGISLASASASLPQISADGTIVGFTDPQFCTTTNATTACGQEGKLLGPPEADLGPGSLQISRNGRWALLASPAPPNQTANATLIDIGSGARTEIPPPPLGTMVALAFDGTVLVRQPAGLGFNQIGLWRQGQFMPISISQPGFAISFTALSDDAGTVIYNATAITSGAPAGNRLVARNLAAGMDTVLYTGQASGELPRFMGASRDARYVLFRVMTPAQGNGPAYIADTVTGQNQPIPLTDGELVTDGTLSGSGNFAILTTTMGRILRVPWNAGTLGSIEPLVPATPYLRVNSGPFSPGSLAQLSGSISNFVQDWQGRVLLDDRPLFVLAVKPGEVDVQVPWEQPTGTAHFRLNLAASVWPGSPFVENQPVFVSPVSPGFLPLPDP